MSQTATSPGHSLTTNGLSPEIPEPEAGVPVEREFRDWPSPLRRRFSLLGLGQPLVEPLPDVLRGVGVAATLVARHHDSTRDDTSDTGQPDPLPYAAHAQSVPKLRT